MRTLIALYSGRKTKSESFEPVAVEWSGTEGRELGGTGAGEGGKREAGSGRTYIVKVLKFPFNIYQC